MSKLIESNLTGGYPRIGILKQKFQREIVGIFVCINSLAVLVYLTPKEKRAELMCA